MASEFASIPFEIIDLIFEYVPEYGFGVNRQLHDRATTLSAYASLRHYLHVTGGHFDSPSPEVVSHIILYRTPICNITCKADVEFVREWWDRLSPYTKVDMIHRNLITRKYSKLLKGYSELSHKFANSSIFSLKNDCEIWAVANRIIATVVFDLPIADLIKWLKVTVTQSRRGDEMIALIMLYFHNMPTLLSAFLNNSHTQSACAMYAEFMCFDPYEWEVLCHDIRPPSDVEETFYEWVTEDRMEVKKEIHRLRLPYVRRMIKRMGQSFYSVFCHLKDDEPRLKNFIDELKYEDFAYFVKKCDLWMSDLPRYDWLIKKYIEYRINNSGVTEHSGGIDIINELVDYISAIK